jgi:hypothetical protein
VESVTLAGSPRYREVTYAGDNSSVAVSAAVADASESGAVRVATVTVAGVANGTTDVSLSVDALGDGANDAYAVTGTDGATLAVAGAGAGGSDAPTARVDAGATTVRVGQSVAFDASASTAPAGAVDSYRWSFGDGGTASGERVFHAFDEPGTYAVEVTVADGDRTDAATATVTVEAANGTGPGEGANVTVRRVVPSKRGALLNDVVFRNTYAATVEASEPVDRVAFRLGGETYVDRDGSDGWNATVDVSVLEGDAPLEVTAYTEDGASDTYTTVVDVVDVPAWLVALNEEGTASYDDGVLTIRKEVPNPPVDAAVTVPDVPVVGGRQEFETRAQFGIVYDMPDGTARVMGSGTLDVRVAGREGSGTLGARGTVSTRTWELQRGQVYVEVSIEAWSSTLTVPGVPYSPEADLSVSPRTRLLANLSTDGGSVAVTNGTISPGIEAEGEVAFDGGVASVTGSLTGTTTGHVDVPAPYDPRVEATVEGELELETLSYEREYERTFFDASVGGGTSTLGAADVAATSDWRPRAKRGAGPTLAGTGDGDGDGDADAVSPAGVDAGVSLGRTSADATGRLTDDDLDDDAPAVAATGDGAVAVWSRQPAADAVVEGRELFVAERPADGAWSAPARLTDDDRTKLQPAIAHDAATDRTVVVWTGLNRSLANLSDPTSVYDRLEVYYAVRSDGNWSAPTLLSTGPRRMDANPRVVADDGRVVVAWTSDADANATTADDRTLRTAVLDDAPASTVVASGVARPVLGADGDAATPPTLAYLEPTDEAGRNGTIVVGGVDPAAGTVAGTTSRAVTRLTALSAGAGEVVWATAGAANATAARDPTVRVANASTGTTTTLRASNATRVTDLALSTTGGGAAADRALVYRAATAGDRPRYRYVLERDGGWSAARPLLERVAAGTVLWKPAAAPTATGFEAVLVARPLDADGTGDLLVARHDLRPDLAVTASVANGSDGTDLAVGDAVRVAYEVRNAGDVATGRSVALAVEGGAGATVGSLPPGGTATGTVEATVPADGTVRVAVDPDDAVPELSATNDADALGLVAPDLAARNVTTTRTGGTVRVAGTVANVGPTDVDDVDYALRTGEGTPLVVGSASLPAGATRTVTATANVSEFTPPGRAVLAVDPADAVAESDETNGTADAAVLRPDVGVAGDAVAFERNGTAVVATVPVANRGTAGANATLRAYVDGTAVANRSVRVERPAADVAASFATVRLRLPATVANGTVTFSVDAVADADPSDDVGTAVATVGPVATPFPDGVPGVSDDPPTNLDDDPRYEDVDGDGARTLADAFALAFEALPRAGSFSDAEVRALDFDGDGTLGLGDVFALAFEG